MLDDGRLTDAKGGQVNFKNSILIMTSNIGAQYLDRMHGIGFGSSDENEQSSKNIRDKVMEALRDQFRPEFLNRLDEMVVFNVLSKEAIGNIVSIQLDIVKKRLAEKEITLEVSPAAVRF